MPHAYYPLNHPRGYHGTPRSLWPAHLAKKKQQRHPPQKVLQNHQTEESLFGNPPEFGRLIRLPPPPSAIFHPPDALRRRRSTRGYPGNAAHSFPDQPGTPSHSPPEHRTVPVPRQVYFTSSPLCSDERCGFIFHTVMRSTRQASADVSCALVWAQTGHVWSVRACLPTTVTASH